MTQAEKAQLRSDILAVITVYDTHTLTENRGPWRDRVVAFADTLAPRDFEHEVVRRGELTDKTLGEVLGG